jgi:hypothetical protein
MAVKVFSTKTKNAKDIDKNHNIRIFIASIDGPVVPWSESYDHGLHTTLKVVKNLEHNKLPAVFLK